MSSYLPKKYKEGRRVDAPFLIIDFETGRVSDQHIGLDIEPVFGIYKLGQQVVLRLLSELGRYIYEPDEGSVFMRYARTNRLTTIANVRTALSESILQVSDQFFLDASRDNTIPPDERLSNIEVTSISQSGDLLLVSLTVTSVASSSISLEAPIGFNYANIT
jgi:hypothetical protein